MEKEHRSLSLLEVKNLKTYFYTEEGVVPAVDGLSFNLDEGEFNAVDAQIIVPDGLKISSSSRNENWKEHTLNSNSAI